MEYLLLTLLGLGVGALGTLIGAGGGFVLMPILLVIYPGKAPEALTAASLAVVFCNAASGTASYARMKRVDFRSGLLFLSVGIPGAALGAVATRYIPRHLFDMLFGAFLIAASGFIFLRPQKELTQAARLPARFKRVLIEADGARHEYAYSLRLGMSMSFVVGFVSSLLGLGGGIIHVPAMVHLLDFPVHVATATSHFVLAGMALTGLLVHVANGTLGGGWVQTACIALGAVVGAGLGARASNHIHGRWIMRSLAVALALVGARILILALWFGAGPRF